MIMELVPSAEINVNDAKSEPNFVPGDDIKISPDRTNSIINEILPLSASTTSALLLPAGRDKCS